MAKQLTDDTFKQEVEDFDGVVMVDFWAEWCAPCKMLEPTIEKLDEKFGKDDNVKILKLNVDENPATAQKFGVMSIPTTIFFKGGQPKGALVGLRPQQSYEEAIDNAQEA